MVSKERFSVKRIREDFIRDWKDSTGKTITMKDAKKHISKIELEEYKKDFDDRQWEKKMRKVKW